MVVNRARPRESTDRHIRDQVVLQRIEQGVAQFVLVQSTGVGSSLCTSVTSK